ncbi:MAG: hypothetical protein KAV87_51400, partial [Desulfobacteraceae bacterium]|nr:hypothetical protein [Desulfobacteraceae bacterium]
DQIVLGFRLSIPENSNWVAKCWDLLFMKRYFTSEAEWVPSGNMIMPRQAFMSVDGFDERLETNEDSDFCYRVRKKGYKVISSSETTVVHSRPPQGLKELFKKELWHGKEAFTVFKEDVLQANNFNIIRRKNFKSVTYAFCYLLCTILIIFSLILSVGFKSVVPISIGLIVSTIIPFLLALKYIILSKKYSMILGMTVIFIVYGFARALSLLRYKKHNRKISKQA